MMAFNSFNEEPFGAPSISTATGPAAAHDSDIAMQEYLALQNQHEELRQQLHDLCPNMALVSSPSVSPTRSHSNMAFPSPPSQPTAATPRGRPSAASNNARRRSSLHSGSSMVSVYSGSSSNSLEPVPEDSSSPDMMADSYEDEMALAEGQAKLCQLNEGIKRALTELLNCDAVRNDRGMRTWVQGRLLDTERERRSGRRRRSSATPMGM